MTTTTTDPKLQKRISVIRKILNQASHPGTPALEAEKFHGKAQQMMEQFNISEAMLAEDEPDDGPAEILKRTVYDRKKGKMPTWILTLARGVAKANRCKHWYSSSRYHGTIGAAGTEANLLSFELLLPFLVGEVDRLVEEEKMPHYELARQAARHGLTTRGYAKRWANSFRLGCATRISQRLREALVEAEKAMKAQAAQTPEEAYKLALESGDTEALLNLDKAPKADPKFALARVETALARLKDDEKRAYEFVNKNMKLRSGGARNHYGTNSGGFNAGHKAGNRASLRGPKGRING